MRDNGYGKMNVYSTYASVYVNSVCETEWLFKFIVAERAMVLTC